MSVDENVQRAVEVTNEVLDIEVVESLMRYRQGDSNWQQIAELSAILFRMDDCPLLKRILSLRNLYIFGDSMDDVA